MENPTAEIESIIRSVTQGNSKEQSAAIHTYFTRTAEFVHPFCRVPSFPPISVPLLGTVSSRDAVHAIYRLYRVLSPRIDLTVDSALLDEANNRLYVDVHQRFALWFVPLYVADVRLVTVLTLAERTDEGHGEKDKAVGPRNGLPSYARIAASRKPLLSESKRDPAVVFDPDAVSAAPESQLRQKQEEEEEEEEGDSQEDGEPKKKYYIAKQEDLYQTSEWIKFLVPFGIGSCLASGFVLFAGLFCFVAALVTRPVVYVLTAGGQRGNVAPKEGVNRQKGRFAEGAAWTPERMSPLATAVGL